MSSFFVLTSSNKRNNSKAREIDFDSPQKKKKNPNKGQCGDAVTNNNIIKDCHLDSDGKFGAVFHPKNKKSFEGEIPLTDGEEICRFHSTAVCFSNCHFKNSHKKLPATIVLLWKAFSNHCHRCYKGAQ